MGSLKRRMDRLEAEEAPHTILESPLQREVREIDEEIERLEADIAEAESRMDEDERRAARTDEAAFMESIRLLSLEEKIEAYGREISKSTSRLESAEGE